MRNSGNEVGVPLELVPHRGENVFSHAHNTGSWYLLGVLFKMSDGDHCPFFMPPPPMQGTSSALKPSRKVVRPVYTVQNALIDPQPTS